MSKKYTVADMQALAAKKNGNFLSTTFQGVKHKHLWQCSAGHQWEATPGHIKTGTWCRKCGFISSAQKRKLTIEEMKAIAEERGGQCLSKEYVNTNTKLQWECVRGHQWEATPGHIKQGQWCPKCGRAQTNKALEAKKLTIEAMHEMAGARGGECLSSEYVNSQTKLKWQCSEGHQWEATPDNIKRGTWCPKCCGKNATIEDMQDIAKERGGKCLSKKYVNSQTKLKWQCSEGHQWEAVPASVKLGTWCRICNVGAPITIEEMQTIAEERGGKCLSKKYLGPHKKLWWECSAEHPPWEATPANIKTGTWCRKCGFISSAQKRKSTLEEMQSIAEERGGQCLSSEYVNAHTKLQWECSESHQWEAIPNKIKNKGTWCPQCSGKISERICREAFEQIFQTPFKSARPKWLVNENGNKMELDGYSPDLKLAFEHQGLQHTQITPYTPTQEKLDKRIRDDEKKIKLCEARGIYLIVVDNILDNFGHFISNPDQFNDQVKNYIGRLCRKKKVVLPKDFETLPIDLFKAYQPELLKEIETIAETKGGKCRSDFYMGSAIPLEFECVKGHRWGATPGKIKQGTWCPVCAGVVKKTLEEMQTMAKDRNGKFLSETYKGVKHKDLWECAEGHQWEATPDSIKNKGQWCPVCAGKQRGTIEEMQKIAKERGGKCLSSQYVNNHTKLKWECSAGHQWEAKPADVKDKKDGTKKGTWCPKCGDISSAQKQKLTIEEMKALAESKGGKCLSSEYVNAHTKLKWQCEFEHQWEATPAKIKQGQWCGKCWGKNATIEDMQAIAVSRGGKCLSEKYLGAHKKLLWECSKGHQWEAVPDKIKGKKDGTKKGTWCPVCAGNRKPIPSSQQLSFF